MNPVSRTGSGKKQPVRGLIRRKHNRKERKKDVGTGTAGTAAGGNGHHAAAYRRSAAAGPLYGSGTGNAGGALSRQPGEKTITKTIINNYSKARLLQKPVGKKYTPEHLLVITLIQTLKQSLSLEDIGWLFAACPEFSGEGRYDAAAVHARYEDFERMKLSQEKLAEAIQENMQDCQAEDLFSQVLYLANLSGALSLTARRLIDTLPQPEKPGRGKKQPAAPKSAAGI